MLPCPRAWSALLGPATALAMFLLIVPASAEVLAEWTPQREAVHGRKLTAVMGPAGTLTQEAVFDADGQLEFDGRQAITFPEAEARKLPRKNFTVGARVRIDQPQKWGCIIGYTQDNGNYERGWLLGYNDRSFCFKLSNGGNLTGAISGEPFTPGEWVNLLAVYDGAGAHLFVNGVHVGAAAIPGEVALPKDGTPFILGAYKDDDEDFPITGRIASVKISSGLPPGLELPAVEVLAPAPTPAPGPPPRVANPVKFAVQPRVAFPDPTTAVISWETEANQESVLFYGTRKTLDTEAVVTVRDGTSSAILANLKPSTVYKYRLGAGPRTKRRYTPIYDLDTRHNLSPAPVDLLPDTAHETVLATEQLLALTPDQNGYLLVLGLNDGRFAAALAVRSRFHVIAADPDPAKVNAVRRLYYQHGLLGHRISVLQLDESGKAPWTDSFADLIVSEVGAPALTGEECLRLLRPNGGVLAVPLPAGNLDKFQGPAFSWSLQNGLAISRRGKIPGATDWTHQYGTAGNAAYTGEALGEVSATSGMRVQWIGRPGGDFGIDRQPRMPAPLAANGRLYHQGMDRLVALNAYNGAVLWSYEIPSLRRLNVPHDCSNWSADDDQLFVAIRDRLWILAARTGDMLHALQLPAPERQTHEWGFVANEGPVVIGSAVRADSSFQDYWGESQWFDQVGSPGSIAQVCSDRLFAYRKSDAASLWTYGRGLVINSTLSLHDGKLIFLENRTLQLPADANGRVSDRRLWLGLTTVCLDALTGQVLWEQPAPTLTHLTEAMGFVQAAYGIATARGFLAVLSEGHVNENGAYLKTGEFHATMYDSAGQVRWTTSSPWLADNHGVHITHPVVTEDRLYLAPEIHDLATGQPLGQSYGPRRGCSTVVATKSALMFRILGEDNSPLGLWDKTTGSVSRFMNLRPSCWLNTLPAQGMLLIPEGGAGCSCGGWIETSVGFLPRSDPAPGIDAPSSP